MRSSCTACQASDYLRERALDEALPWSVVQSGVTPAYLVREMRRAQTTAGGAAIGMEDLLPQEG